jgi:hypothetical protein
LAVACRRLFKSDHDNYHDNYYDHNLDDYDHRRPRHYHNDHNDDRRALFVQRVLAALCACHNDHNHSWPRNYDRSSNYILACRLRSSVPI